MDFSNSFGAFISETSILGSLLSLPTIVGLTNVLVIDVKASAIFPDIITWSSNVPAVVRNSANTFIP